MGETDHGLVVSNVRVEVGLLHRPHPVEACTNIGLSLKCPYACTSHGRTGQHHIWPVRDRLHRLQKLRVVEERRREEARNVQVRRGCRLRCGLWRPSSDLSLLELK